jgi:hypothetical protein
MSEDMASHIGPQQIDAVLEFLPAFESPGYKFGEWTGSGYFSYSPEVDDWIRTLYEQNILLPFDWTRWREEAQRYRSTPGALQTAGLLTLRKLLTTHVRADRFVEGHLASVLESGHVTAILRRLKQIRDQMP